MDTSRYIVKKLREHRLLQERKDYESMDRNELIKLAQDGDQFAMTTLVNNHQDFLNRMTKRYFLNSSSGDRDDLKQIATMAFWEAVRSYDGGDFEAYAGMIIKRRLTDEVRKDQAGKTEINTDADSFDRVISRQQTTGGEGQEVTLGDITSNRKLSPEEEYLGNEGAKRIIDFIENELSDVERTCIRKYIQGYKVSEISEEENIKYKSVENALRRVKNKLSDYLSSVKESRSLKLNESFFTDEEKEILMSVLNKIEDKPIKESTEEEIDYEDELAKIESDIEAARDIIETTSSDDDYNDAINMLEDLNMKLWDILEEVEDADLVKEAQRLQDLIDRVKYIHPDNIDNDPYKERGLRRSDFF